LIQIFFRDKDFVKEGSKQYDDFWLFFKKYQVYQHRQKQNKNLQLIKDNIFKQNEATPFNFPQDYQPRLSKMSETECLVLTLC